MTKSSKKIVITGTSGFIGQNLIKELAKKGKTYRIHAFQRSVHDFQKPQSLIELIKNADAVYHLAHLSRDAQSKERNIAAALSILNVTQKYAPTARLIFTSSFAVYALPKKGTILKENSTIKPRNMYGETKLLIENLIRKKLSGTSNSYVILRLSNVYGSETKPFDRSVIATIKARMSQRKSIIIRGNGSQARDFVYISDVVKALVKASTHEKLGNVVLNICSGEETSILGLLSLIQESSKIPLQQTFQKATREDLGFWKGNNSLAEQRLSWRPKVSIRKGIQLVFSKKKI